MYSSTKMQQISMFSNPFRIKFGHYKRIKFARRTYVDFRNPFTRTWDIISADVTKKKKVFYPEHTDIAIIGSGFIGSAIAYSLKSRAGPGLSVVVLEKDDVSCKENESAVVLGTLSQHYSLVENIHLAQHSAEFFRNVKEHLNTDIDIQYYPTGRLLLASEKYADHLEKNVDIQREHGMRNELLSPNEIHKRYPWLDTSQIKLGCISTECEGVFNAKKFLTALIDKNKELGVTHVKAEVVGFSIEKQRDLLMEGVQPGTFQKIRRLIYKTPDKELHELNFAACILAAGHKSGEIAKMAKIGTGSGLLTVPLPIDKREYNIYSFNYDPKLLPMGLNTPYIMDTSGLWLRKKEFENSAICGHIPTLEEPIQDELNNLILPSLLYRIPGCKNVKVNHVATEIYDCNTFDDTGILGPHVYHGTLFIAAGFGSLGCQHAPGIGRAMAELIIDGQFTSIDLTRFGFDRILTDYPLVELNVY